MLFSSFSSYFSVTPCNLITFFFQSEFLSFPFHLSFISLSSISSTVPQTTSFPSLVPLSTHSLLASSLPPPHSYPLLILLAPQATSVTTSTGSYRSASLYRLASLPATSRSRKFLYLCYLWGCELVPVCSSTCRLQVHVCVLLSEVTTLI